MKIYGRVYKNERERDNKDNLEKLSKQINSNNLLKIDIINYKPFKIGDLFDVERGKRIVKNRDYIEENNDINIYPVITAKTTNNGIDGYYKKYNCEGNVICCGGEATGMISFYQEHKCWVMDRSRILKPKFSLNRLISLFLIPQLNKYNKYFNYGNSANPEEIKKLSINLPVDQEDNPDWKYMEEFIKMREREIIKIL